MTAMEKTLYTAVAHAAGDGRNGRVFTDDGFIEADVRIPKEMGGAGGATNPEQLFAAGYAACFHSALRLIGGQQKINVADSAVSASVHIGALDNGGFGLAVELDVSLPQVDAETARKAVEAAHQVCPYSNATRGNIDVTLNVV
nr:organic hydroperoxide resistance protein [Nocardioides insulae]